MKVIFTAMILVIFALNASSQVTFWTEDFENSCTSGCSANGYSGSNGAWSIYNNHPDVGCGAPDYPNTWYVSCAENGNAAGACGTGCGNDESLHVGSTSAGDAGAAYDAGGYCPFLGWAGTQTYSRCASPIINCTGRSNITLSFVYIEGGQGTTDNATFYISYDGGTTWSLYVDLAKTPTGACGVQGQWTTYTTTLPAAADNNPNVRIAFLWVNNDDAVGSDPSFAVDDITLTVPSAGTPPVANFSSSDTTICVGSCINFTDLSTNTPTSWAWTFAGAATASSGAQNPSGICYNVVGDYTVELTATNAFGFDVETKTSFIHVVALPSVTASATVNPICAGQNTNISSGGATSYVWDQGLGAGSGFTVSPGSATTYSVTGTDANGCVNIGQVTINVNSLPTIGITGTSPICDGDNSLLTGTGGTGYSWSTLESTTSITVSPASTTTYTVTGTDGTCSNTASFQVVVNTLPTIGITGTSPICDGDNSLLTGTGGTGYSWSTLESTTSITVSPTSTTTYTVTGTDGTCSNTATFQVVVNTVPVASITGPTSVCAGGTVTLTATGGAGVYTYGWSTLDVTSDIDVSPSANTTYYVTVSAGTCSDSASHTVTVAPLPVIGIAGTASICVGENSILTASGGTGYTWSTTQTINPITVYPTTTTTYTVTGTDGTCSNTSSFQVVVNPLPSIGISGTTAICEGDNTTLSGTGGTSYIWSTLETTNSILVAPLSTQTYTVTGTDGTCSNTSSATVTVNTVPVAAITGDTIVCAGDVTILTASGGTGYLWSNAATSASVSVSPSVNQYYYVTVSNGPCTDVDSIFVTVNPLPVADAGNDTTIYLGTSANLLGAGGLLYSWTPPDGLSCTDCSNPVATPDQTTLYTLVVTDANGCSSSDDVLITVEYNCGDVFVPTAFSPNADGNNDVFVVRGNCIETITFKVFDRWGEKVYETTVPGEGWNGEFQGQAVNGGVYSYYYSGTLITGEIITGKGNVTLIR